VKTDRAVIDKNISPYTILPPISQNYGGRYESNATNFVYSEKLIVIIMKFTWTIHTSFAIMRLFFHKVSVIFNTPLPTLSKTLYISAVKIPASTSEHITRTLFQFVVICKCAFIGHSLQGQTGGSRKVPDLGFERGGESPTHFCDCLTCAQVGVRSGIVVKEKDVFLVSVRTNSRDVLSQFV
jgi:hypothetical protein